MSTLRFLKRKEIDVPKWNDAIANASNSLPYAFAWYLDIVAENWDALILGDYEAVMPLVWLRKLGIKCLYQPYYCQQLGVFGQELSKEVQHSFLAYVAQHFSYVNINLNASAGMVSEEFGLKAKKNLLLDLSREYELLKKRYSENHQRNIKKAVKAGVRFSENTGLQDFQEFYLGNVDRKRENFKEKHEAIFRKFTEEIIKDKLGTIFSVNSQEGNLLAASLIIRQPKRLINIINTSSASGKNSGASHILFDGIIEAFSSTDVILDFEGSSIPGVARFYEGFDPKEQRFYNYQTSIFAQQKQRLG